MDETQFVSLTDIMKGLLDDAASLQGKAARLLFNSEFTDPEFIRGAQMFLEKHENEFIREDMENRAAQLWESIKATRPKKLDGYKDCTARYFHEWETLFDGFPKEKGRVTVRRCECGAYHEEWWNNKERYLVRNWNAKEVRV